MNQAIPKELIEKYLAGSELTPPELTRMDAALAEIDPEFQRQLDEIMVQTTWNETLLEGIRYTGEQQLKKKLSMLAPEFEQEGLLLTDEDMEAWHTGELSQDKMTLLENRRLKDPAFAADLEARGKLLGSIRTYGKERLREKIESAHQSLEQEGFFARQEEALQKERREAKVIPMTNRRRWVMAAAAIVLVLVAAAIWLVQRQRPSPEKMYAQRFEVYPDNVSAELRSIMNQWGHSGSAEETKWTEFLSAMETYPEAAAPLESFLEKYPGEKIATFYLAQTQLKKEQFAEAKSNLETVASDPAAEQRWAAKWYLALISLKENDLEKLRSLLNELRQAPLEFRQQAEDLQAEMDF